MSSRATLKFLVTISLACGFCCTKIPLLQAQSSEPSVYRIKKSGEAPAALAINPEVQEPSALAAVPEVIPENAFNLPPQEQAVLYQWNERQNKPQKMRANQAVDSSNFVNHEVLGKIYKKYVNKHGWVDYRGLKKDIEAQEMLKAYIEDMLALDPSELKAPQDRLASWLNLYNALVIREIVKQYPVKNLMEMKNFFGAPRLKLGDQQYSFVDIEKVIFQEVIHDPRAVFARVHGASSGPKLLPIPYDGAKIDEQLDQQVMDFLLNPENVRYDPKTRTLYLNQIFIWYAKELGDVQAFLAIYLDRLPQRFKVVYMGYNFGLNDERYR